MNWHENLYEIYSQLESNGFETLWKEIHEAQLEGATGGENFGLVITKLIFIKRNQPEIYSIIKTEVDEMIDYGKSIGYLKFYHE